MFPAGEPHDTRSGVGLLAYLERENSHPHWDLESERGGNEHSYLNKISTAPQRDSSLNAGSVLTVRAGCGLVEALEPRPAGHASSSVSEMGALWNMSKRPSSGEYAGALRSVLKYLLVSPMMARAEKGS